MPLRAVRDVAPGWQVAPVEESMERPQHFMRAVGTAYGSTALLNCVFGALWCDHACPRARAAAALPHAAPRRPRSYMLWGAAVEDIVVDSLSPGAFTSAVKILLFLDLTFSFPIVLAPARELTERYTHPQRARPVRCSSSRSAVVGWQLAGGAAVQSERACGRRPAAQRHPHVACGCCCWRGKWPWQRPKPCGCCRLRCCCSPFPPLSLTAGHFRRW